MDPAAIEALSDELRAIAAFGINFATSPYDVERWEGVLSVCARLNELSNGRSAEELFAAYRERQFMLAAYPSAEAVVMQENRLLLVRRRDDGLWALPGGITDPGETLAESAQRELWEETGIRARPRRLLGIFDSRHWHSEKKIHFYHAVFEFVPENGQPRPADDAVEARYFAEDELPPLSPGHHLRAPFAFRQLRGEEPVPFFDPPE